MLFHPHISIERAARRGVALALSAVGCSGTVSPGTTVSGAEHVRIEPIAAQYRAGDSVWVNVRNIGEVDVAFNLCRASRERFETGTGWVSSAVLDRNCPDALALLRVGTTARIFVEAVPVGVSTGLYRYTFTGLQIDGAVLPKPERESASFRVRE